MEDKYKKLGKNTLLMVIGNFASRLLSFFLLPLYTFYLTTSEYGISDLISTTVQLLVPLLSLVASEAIIRFALDREFERTYLFTISTTISILGFSVLLVASPLLYRIVPFQNYYLYFLLCYVFSLSSLNLQQFSKGLEHIGTFVISGILNTIVTISLNIFLIVFLHKGIEGYLIALISGTVSQALFISVKEKIWLYFIPVTQISKKYWIQYLVFCLPLIPNSLSWWISNSSDKYILQLYWGAALTGIYAVSYKIPSIISMLSSIFTSAWQISAVEDFGTDESKKFISTVYDNYSSLCFIGCSIIVLFNRQLASFLFSKDFYFAWPYSIVLTFAAIFQSLAGFIGVIYTTAKKTKTIFITTILGAVGNILLNFLLIPEWGAYGASIATFLSYFIVWLVRLIDSRRIIRYTINIKRFVACVSLLFIQSLVTCIDFPKHVIISVFIVFLELVINHKFLKKLIFLALRKIKDMR